MSVNTTALVLQLQAEVEQLRASGDVRWSLLTGANCFFMLLGFALLEAGSLRAKNLSAVMLKQFVVACVVGVCFYFWAFGLGFGKSAQSDATNFVGTANFALYDIHHDNTAPYVNWFFQMTFCGVACSIISGAIGERMKFGVYFCSLFVIGGWVYPTVAYAQWSTGGWNSPFHDGSQHGHIAGSGVFSGVIDAAGCGAVHLVGGVCALVGAWMVGPRRGRFDPDTKKPVPMPGHNSAYITMGVMILWFAWYAFNSGGLINDAKRQYLVVGRSAANTAIASCVAGLTTLLVESAPTGFTYWPLTVCLNGVLCGLVTITAGSTVVEPWGAFVIGIISAFAYLGASWLILEVLNVDDPVDAAAVHGTGGILGLFLTGLFAQHDAMKVMYSMDLPVKYAGAFMGGDGSILGYNMLHVVFVIAWAGLFSFLYFFIAEKVLGTLRVTSEDEDHGMDAKTFGGDGYDYLTPLQQVDFLKKSLHNLSHTLLDGNPEGNPHDHHVTTNADPTSAEFKRDQEEQQKQYEEQEEEEGVGFEDFSSSPAQKKLHEKEEEMTSVETYEENKKPSAENEPASS